MNITYIIGNGFDINLELKTKYKDFYNYYQSLPSKKDSVKLLKDNIQKNLENWSDLEFALGIHTENFSATNDFIEVFEDIGDNLGDYLLKQEAEFNFSNINTPKLNDYFSFPEKSLPRADENEILKYKSQWAKENWDVKIITLNYTKSLEHIFDNQFSALEIGTHHNSKIILRGIEHIHGFSDERMIMGVNDNSQIKNQSFHNNQDILEALIKSDCNKAQKHTVDDICRTQITKANLICIFGSSIGDTDNCWWQLIGEQLKNGTRLIIFTKGHEISKRWGYKKAKNEREMKNYFFSKTNLTDEEKMSLSENVYVGVNTEMFSDIIL